MAKHNEIGQTGELRARRFLEEKGYKVAETNWRYRRAEIDLICWDEGILVFVEVRTRTSEEFGRPLPPN